MDKQVQRILIANGKVLRVWVGIHDPPFTMDTLRLLLHNLHIRGSLMHTYAYPNTVQLIVIDIGGTDDQHCVNFLVITLLTMIHDQAYRIITDNIK